MTRIAREPDFHHTGGKPPIGGLATVDAAKMLNVSERSVSRARVIVHHFYGHHARYTGCLSIGPALAKENPPMRAGVNFRAGTSSILTGANDVGRVSPS
jgi:hypothetical protein